MKEGLQLISESQVFKRGADLWILSDPQHSSWHCKIDWYLCFQIKKTRSQKIQKPSSQMQSLLKKYQISTVKWNPPRPSPLLIESSAYLPNLWTVELIYTEEWLNKVYDIWYSLNQPKLRIFAPQSIKKEKIKEKWESVAKKTLSNI